MKTVLKVIGVSVLIGAVAYSYWMHSHCTARGGEPIQSLWTATRCSK